MGIFKDAFNLCSYYHLIYFILSVIILSIYQPNHLCGNILTFIIIAIIMSFFGFIISNYKIQKTLNYFLIWAMLNIFFISIYITNYLNLECECIKDMKENYSMIWNYYYITAYSFSAEFVILAIFLLGGSCIQLYQYIFTRSNSEIYP